MSTTFRVPDPPASAKSPHVVRATLEHGRCAGCCVCNQVCWTWWSPNPPSGYAPLHEKCVDRLFEQWSAMRAAGVVTTTSAVPTKERVGAYARLQSTVDTVPTGVVALTGQKAAVLPEGFQPGVFWLPGDTADSPWTMLAVTAAGVSTVPCSDSEQAHQQARLLSLLPEAGERIPVVGAVVVAPDGTWSHCWGRIGDAPKRLRFPHEQAQSPFALWSTIMRMSEWWTCAGCHETRWPSAWSELMSLRCLSCLAKDEIDDPRPAVIEPPYPGDRYLPEWLTKPGRRLGLPKGYRRR